MPSSSTASELIFIVAVVLLLIGIFHRSRRRAHGFHSTLRLWPRIFVLRARGFHLAPHKEEYLRQTMKELVDLDVDYIVPMHCTGEPFYEMLKAELPKKVIRSYTGTKLVFGA